MADSPLPDDVLTELQYALTEIIGKASMVERAELGQALIDKYTPKPETLADHGTITWTRLFEPSIGRDHLIEKLARDYRDPPLIDGIEVPWPEVEGINPADLLNDGWQLRAHGDVPKGWWVLLFNAKRETYKGKNLTIHPDVVVVCCPPQTETAA